LRAAPLIPLTTLLIALLLTVSWLAQAPLPYDIDDMGDLTHGCASWHSLNITYGPLYRAFYCALSTLWPDLVVVFDFKQVAMMLIPGGLLYVLLRRYAILPMLAAGFSLWFVLSLLRFNGTSEFAFALALLACISAARGKTAGWIGFFLLLTLAFLVRSEYALGIVGGILLLLPLSQSRQTAPLDNPAAASSSAQSAAPRTALLTGVLCFSLCIGLYLAGPTSNDRFWVAFGQHFALNYQETNIIWCGVYREP
jgi:hypothetical protein